MVETRCFLSPGSATYWLVDPETWLNTIGFSLLIPVNVIRSFLISICGNYEIIWGVIWNLQAVMILGRSDMLPYPLAVGSEGESEVAGHGHQGRRGWNTPEHACIHTTSFYLFLTRWQCSYYFFLKWDFTCQNTSFFWAHPQQVLVPVFTSLLGSPDVYYWEYLVMQYIRALSFQVGSKGYVYSGYVLLNTYNKSLYLLHSILFAQKAFSL